MEQLKEKAEELEKFLQDRLSEDDFKKYAVLFKELVMLGSFSDIRAIIEETLSVNIIELDTVDEANKVDLSVYRWSERMSAKTGKYVFVRRQIKRGK